MRTLSSLALWTLTLGFVGAVAFGCGDNTGGSSDAAADAAPGADLQALPDLARGPVCDMSVCGGKCVDENSDSQNCGQCGLVCPAGVMCMAGFCGVPATYRYAISSLKMPMNQSQYAIDLNGDDKVDNHLGAIISALNAFNINAQMSIDTSLKMGTSVYLLTLRSTDPKLSDDPVAALTLYGGVPMMMPMPDFSGAGMFTVDMAVTPARVFGSLAATKYASENPVTTKRPVNARVALALLAGQAPLILPMNGVHFQVTTATVNNLGVLTNGELHGSVKTTDVVALVIPQIAALMTQQLMANPMSMSSMQITTLFDIGGCVDANGTMAKSKDGTVTVCEVSQNSIVQQLLKPDVQIFDAMGNYAPNAMNTTKDSLSVGLGFEAVTAKF